MPCVRAESPNKALQAPALDNFTKGHDMLIRQTILVLGMSVFIALLFPLADWLKEIGGDIIPIPPVHLAVLFSLAPALVLLWHTRVLKRLSERRAWLFAVLSSSVVLYLTIGWPLTYRWHVYDVEAALRVSLLASLVGVLLTLRPPEAPSETEKAS